MTRHPSGFSAFVEGGFSARLPSAAVEYHSQRAKTHRIQPLHLDGKKSMSTPCPRHSNRHRETLPPRLRTGSVLRTRYVVVYSIQYRGVFMDHGDHADYGKLYAIHTGCLAMIHDQFAIGCGVMWSRRAASCAFSIGDKAFFAGVRASTALSRTRVAIAPTCGQTLFRGPCGGGTRNMSFSFPGPRKLKDITNLPLLEKEPLEQIADIWSVYHEERTDTFGTSLPGDALKDLQSKAKRCPMFVLPVWRDNGHFMMLSQYQDTCFLLTFLEDYKVNPGGAQPYATISVYDDLVDSKGLGLIRADITPNLTKKEVARLVRLLIRFYSPHAHHHVEAFNLRPEEFDLDQLMKETPAE